MTIEELKAEAKKHGYKLVQITSDVHILPCPICGCTRTVIWHKGSMIYRACGRNGCTFKGYISKNKLDSKRKWNTAVLDYQNKEDLKNDQA